MFLVYLFSIISILSILILLGTVIYLYVENVKLKKENKKLIKQSYIYTDID